MSGPVMLKTNLRSEWCHYTIHCCVISDVGTDGVFRQTPLHLAVGEGNVAAIGAILETSKVKPNLNLKNSSGQTVLALALGNEMEDIAAELLKGLGLLFFNFHITRFVLDWAYHTATPFIFQCLSFTSVQNCLLDQSFIILLK